MSVAAWQTGFANSNSSLAESLNGSLEKPWWAVIPPFEWLETNVADISEYLSCNINCLKVMIESMKNSGNFDATV